MIPVYTTWILGRGVGCIFAEIISGIPLFPGLKDASDQVVRIWQVLGTPNEQTWPGVERLPEFKKREFYTKIVWNQLCNRLRVYGRVILWYA